MRRLIGNRRGAAPRSAIYLAAALALALTVLFFLKRNPAPPDLTLGGRLFNLEAAQIEGLLLTRGGAQYRIDRTGEGEWALSGAVSDFLDQDAVVRLLQDLTKATGGHLLPGTDIEDRRYDFNSPGAIRLTLFGLGGVTERLALGARNPVTGAYYGSGAGRQACFPVSAGLRERLAALPSSVQLKTLLPELERGSVTAMVIDRGKQRDQLVHREDRWWLKLPEQGSAVLGPWYRDYTEYYGDRREERDGAIWVLADDQVARLLIYESSRVIVKEILPPGDAVRRKEQLGLDPPWRRVILEGVDINPDPTAGPPDELEIDFGQSADEQRVPAGRRGNVLMAEKEAINTVSQPVASWLDTRALGFDASLADSMVLEREGRILLRAHRDQQGPEPGVRFKERPVDFWLTDLPAETTPVMDERARQARSRNLMANLDRTPALKVLPPTDVPAVLQDRERLRLIFWFADGPTVPGVGRGMMVLEIGFLDTALLPLGSPPLARVEDGLDPVGLWRPDTGQLLQIPGFIVTTARAWAQ